MLLGSGFKGVGGALLLYRSQSLLEGGRAGGRVGGHAGGQVGGRAGGFVPDGARLC